MTPRRAVQLLMLLPLRVIAAVDAEADRWRAHVRFLADDALVANRPTGPRWSDDAFCRRFAQP